MGARGVVFLAIAFAGESAPGVTAVGPSGPTSNATIASKVAHKTVNRVVGFSRGSNFRKSHIATARNAPSKIPLRRVVIRKLRGVTSYLLARSGQSSF